MRTGEWQGWHLIGNSMIVDVNGQVVRRGSYGRNAEEIIYQELVLPPRPARGTDWEKFLARNGNG